MARTAVRTVRETIGATRRIQREALADEMTWTRLDAYVHPSANTPPPSLPPTIGSIFIGADGSWWLGTMTSWTRVAIVQTQTR